MVNHPNRARYGAIALTPGEAKAALNAISQMTDGNARSFDEWKLCTSGTAHEWNALLRAEAKIAAMLANRK